jgi:hypothetical protein
MMADDSGDLSGISPADRKRYEELGEAYVRQIANEGGIPQPLGFPASKWLAEKEQERQAKQARITKSTFIAAWIAAIGTIVGIIVMFALWDHPRH